MIVLKALAAAALNLTEESCDRFFPTWRKLWQLFPARRKLRQLHSYLLKAAAA